jgi:hypothetical protein
VDRERCVRPEKPVNPNAFIGTHGITTSDGMPAFVKREPTFASISFGNAELPFQFNGFSDVSSEGVANRTVCRIDPIHRIPVPASSSHEPRVASPCPPNHRHFSTVHASADPV